MKKKRQSLVYSGVQLKLRDKYIKELREIEKKLDPEPQPKSFFRKLYDFATGNTEVSGPSTMTPQKEKLFYQKSLIKRSIHTSKRFVRL